MKQVVKGTLWLTVGSFISKGLVVLSYIILARILSVEAYGEYGMIKATIDNFLIFATMGLGITVTKFIAELKTDNPALASTIIGTALLCVLVLSAVLFFAIVLFSDTMATNLLQNDTLHTPLLIAGGILFFIAVSTVIQGTLLGLQRYKHIFIINAVQGVLLLLGLSLGGYFYGVLGAVAGNLLAIIVMTLTAFLLLFNALNNTEITISFRHSKKALKKIAGFALPASLAMLVGAPAVWLLNAQLANTSNGYQQLGIYSAVLIFSLALRTVNTGISNAVLPLFLDKAVVLTGKKQFLNYHGAWLICLGLSAPLLVFPEIGAWILGSKYPIDEVTIILSLTLFSTLCFSFKQGISRDLIKQNKMWYSAFSMLFWATVVFVVFYFVQHLGAVGFAIAFCAGYLANVLVAVPFYIAMKFTPGYAFSSLWLFVTVVLVVGLLILNNVTESILIRSVVSLLLLLCIMTTVRKLYGAMIKLNVT